MKKLIALATVLATSVVARTQELSVILDNGEKAGKFRPALVKALKGSGIPASYDKLDENLVASAPFEAVADALKKLGWVPATGDAAKMHTSPRTKSPKGLVFVRKDNTWPLLVNDTDNPAILPLGGTYISNKALYKALTGVPGIKKVVIDTLDSADIVEGVLTLDKIRPKGGGSTLSRAEFQKMVAYITKELFKGAKVPVSSERNVDMAATIRGEGGTKMHLIHEEGDLEIRFELFSIR